jgi:predicted phosphodiesterase
LSKYRNKSTFTKNHPFAGNQYTKRTEATGKTNKKDLEEAIKVVENSGYFVTREPLQRGYTFNLNLGKEDDGYKIGIVSDTHLGSKYQQLENLHKFYDLCEAKGITKVVHAGDISDGQDVYKGHVYEVFKIGADEILEYVVKNYPSRDGIVTELVCGNHDESLYKKGGMDIGKRIFEKRPDIIHRGFYAADFILPEGLRISVHHGRGSGAYALSYKLQKLAEALVVPNQPEQNPNLVLLGHFHKACTLADYMGMQLIMCPCFQGQTPLGKALGGQPSIAGMIVELTPGEIPRFSYKKYTEVKEDY